MAIVERAFSYGGLLVRTFHHADATPPETQPAASEAPSPPWTSEQLPPPKRPRGGKKRKTGDPLSPIQLDLSGLLTPGTTPSGLQDCGPAFAPRPEYISLLTPEELRAIQTRHRRGKLWIPPESTVRKELDRLGRGSNREASIANMKTMLADGPVRYMQETGCITDVDRFTVEGALGVPGLKESSVPTLETDDSFTGVDYGATNTWNGGSAQSRAWDMGKHSGAQAAMGIGGGSEHIHPSPIHGVTLPSPISVPTTDGQHGLYLPPLSAQAANNEPIPPPPGLPVQLSLPGPMTDKSRTASLLPQPLYESLPPSSEDTPAQATAQSCPITSATPQPKRSRGRPRKTPQTTDSNHTPEASSSTGTASSFTPPAPTQSPSAQKRKRVTPPSKSTNTPHKPPPLHLPSVSDFLSHLTSTIEAAASGFIPRPVSASYTLPTPAFSLVETSDKDYKSFAVGLVAKIAEIDKLQWTIAHSQWTTSKSKFTAGARWVCNLSEEGVRDRGSKGGAPVGVGMRTYTSSDDTPAPKPRYPCGGSIAVRFSTNKDIITIRYTHHAVHAPPKDLREEAQIQRVKEHRKLIVNDGWGSTPPPLPLPLPPTSVVMRRIPLQVVETKVMKGVAIGESEAEGGGRWVWERRVE